MSKNDLQSYPEAVERRRAVGRGMSFVRPFDSSVAG